MKRGKKRKKQQIGNEKRNQKRFKVCNFSSVESHKRRDEIYIQCDWISFMWGFDSRGLFRAENRDDGDVECMKIWSSPWALNFLTTTWSCVACSFKNHFPKTIRKNSCQTAITFICCAQTKQKNILHSAKLHEWKLK